MPYHGLHIPHIYIKNHAGKPDWAVPDGNAYLRSLSGCRCRWLVHCRNKIYSRIPRPEKERQRLRQFSGNLALLHRHICNNCHNYNQKFRIYLENISEQQPMWKPAYHCCVLCSFRMHPLCYFKLFYRT